MENLWPVRGARSTCRELALAGMRRMVASSLILFLAAGTAHRAWTLLNSDVGELMRRLH